MSLKITIIYLSKSFNKKWNGYIFLLLFQRSKQYLIFFYLNSKNIFFYFHYDTFNIQIWCMISNSSLFFDFNRTCWNFSHFSHPNSIFTKKKTVFPPNLIKIKFCQNIYNFFSFFWFNYFLNIFFIYFNLRAFFIITSKKKISTEKQNKFHQLKKSSM